MKPDIRWQLLLAVAGFSLVFALLTFQVQTAGLCSVRVPAAGGVFAEGMVGSPQFLNPLLADENPVDREISSLVFDGLTRYENGELIPALAESWEISEDGQTILFNLRDDIVWHDGEPFTAADVVLTYRMMQADDFPGSSSLRRFWQSVTIRNVDRYQVSFELQEPYAGFLDATRRGILPAHLLQGVSAAELADSDLNRQPIGTGPFMVDPGQNWQQQHSLSLVPNPNAWREGSLVANLLFRFYADESSLLDAFEQGEIQAMNSVSPAMLPEVAQMPQARLFTAPAPRYTSLMFNLTDDGSLATQSLAVRKALANGLDREALVDETLNGQGVLQNGPYLRSSWAYNPGPLTLYGSQPISATAGLDAAGWTLAEGEAVRRSGETSMILRFLVYDTPTNRKVAEKIASEWETLGVAPQLTFFSDWRGYRQSLRERNFDVALVEVAPRGDPDLYDFWSQEAIINGQNYAGWNRRRASEALEEGRRIWPNSERRPFYDSFLRYYDEDLPELALFQHVYTYAVNEEVEGVEIGRIDHARDRYQTMADWILLYRDVMVSCPEDQA
jgi:peptide/nickel transport system substrate-binding protein